MKKIILLVLAAAAIASCTHKVPEFRYQTIAEKAKYCIDTTACPSAYYRFPVFTEDEKENLQKINDDIYSQIVGSKEETINEAIESFSVEFLQYEQYMNEKGYTDYATLWFDSTNVHVRVLSPKLLVTALFNYQFTGGAHGSYTTLLSNYDLENGSRLTLESVFNDTVELKKIITERFYEQRTIEYSEFDKTKSLSENGYFVEGETLPVTENFALLEDGVLFVYNIYEIAPYVYGQTDVKVPYDLVRDKMKYIPDFSHAVIYDENGEKIEK